MLRSLQVTALEAAVSIQSRAVRTLQGGAAATALAIKSSEKAAEQAGHREVQGLEQKLDSKTSSMAREMETLNKKVRSLERENVAQKAQLEAALRQSEV